MERWSALVMSWAAAGALMWGGVGAHAADLNGNGTDDAIDIADGVSLDCDLDGVPDEVQGPPSDAIVALRFDEPSGGLAVNDGYGADAAITGATRVNDAPFPSKGNRSLEFTAGNQAVTIVAGPELDVFAGGFTLAAWIRLTTTSGLHYVIWGDDDIYSLAVRDGELQGSVQQGKAVSAPFTATGVWKHVALTFAEQTARLYVDGEEVASGARGVSQVGPLGMRKLVRVGIDETADLFGFQRDLRGRVDDVVIVDRALTLQEIGVLVRQRLVPPAPPCSTFGVDLSFPAFRGLTTTLAAPLGDVGVSAVVAIDERGRIVADGPCTVDGVDATVSGKASVRKGVATYKLKLRTTSPARTVVVSGGVEAATANAVYKGPDGKVTLRDVPVVVTVEDSALRIALSASLSGNGRIRGTAAIESTLGAGLVLDGKVSGRLQGDRLRLSFTAGPWRISFDGTRSGEEFAGVVSAVIPPARPRDLPATLPDFTQLP